MRLCLFARTMARHRSYFLPSMGILSRQFSGMGHEVTVITGALPDGSGGVFHDDGAEAHYLAGEPQGRDIPVFWQDSARLFDRLHAERPFDFVVGRGESANGYLRHSRFSGQVPLICHEGTYPLWLHQIETRNSRLLTAIIPAVALLFAFHKRHKRYCLRQAARVVCNSPALAKGLVRADWWAPPKTVFIPYGFDLSRFPEQPAGPASPARLVFVGRLTWDKGIMTMIDILAQLDRKDVIFEAIGPVSDRIRAALVTHAARRGVADRFLMPGPAQNTDLPARLAGATAFVFPSTHPEGLSKAVMEAMAAGLPVVAYDIPGQDTLVEHGVTGWLEPPRSPGRLLQRIDMLLEDPALCRQMGQAGRARVERMFAPDAVTRQWEALLETVLAETSTVPPSPE